jgi:uncharacterized membrane protein HdeD (DUF308 family)
MTAAPIAVSIRHHWWLFLLRGLAAIIFGGLAIMWPGATVVVLTAFIAAYALVDGVVAIAAATRMRSAFDRWWVLLIQGIISTVFGVWAFINPLLSLLYIVISVSLWMFLAAIVQFMLARAHRAMGTSPVWSILGGILSLVVAVVALAFPRLTVATVVLLVAWFALVIGVLQLVIAFRVRRLVVAIP